MLNWIKRLLGIAPVESKQEPLVLTQEMYVEETTKPKKTTTQKPKTSTKKKEKTLDYSTMKKDELLAYAKEKGIKANASLKKEEIIERIQNS
jgi:hypothetical protein